MGFGIVGAQGATPAAQGNVGNDFSQLLTALKEVNQGIQLEIQNDKAELHADRQQGAKELKEEASLADNRMRGQVKTEGQSATIYKTIIEKQQQRAPESKESQQSGTSTQQGKGGVSDDLVAAFFAAVSKEEEIKKKNKGKKTKFEEKLEMLMKLDGEFDLSALPQEDQEIIKEFFNNMGRIKTLKEKLKQIEHQENRLFELLKRLKKEGQLNDIIKKSKKGS